MLNQQHTDLGLQALNSHTLGGGTRTGARDTGGGLLGQPVPVYYLIFNFVLSVLYTC